MAERDPQAGSDRESRLRAELEEVRDGLIEAGAELADRMAVIHAFESRVEARLGALTDRLAALEGEVQAYLNTIEDLRYKRLFGEEYGIDQEPTRRTWEVPPSDAARPPERPPAPDVETQIKVLYRDLARRYHPDLAVDELDREYRTEKMAAINNAYAARSLAELKALAIGAKGDVAYSRPSRVDQSELRRLQTLEDELVRTRRRLDEVRSKLKNLHLHPSVQLSLDIKLARSQGRDLLHEMAADLKGKISRKTVERDYLKAQLEQLGQTGNE